MAMRRAKWLTVGPLVSVLARWTRRLVGADNGQDTDTSIELSKGDTAWPPPLGQDPGDRKIMHETGRGRPRGESV